jgi:pimeloyl-ACP methyl ester carboxylesterase
VNLSSALPHVLLLPGNMCDARLWQGGDHIIVKAIEAMGLGWSHVDFQDDNTIEAMAARALSFCDGPIIPIGFSMGGIVALKMARIAQHRLVAMCLLDTTSHADTRGLERLRQQEDVRQGQLAKVVTQELKPNYLAKCNANNSDLQKLLCDMAMDLGPDVFLAQSEALRNRSDLTPVLDGLKLPILIACGEEDSLCPIEQHWAMTQKIPNAQLFVIPRAGHVLPLEQPQLVADFVSLFLSKRLGVNP